MYKSIVSKTYKYSTHIYYSQNPNIFRVSYEWTGDETDLVKVTTKGWGGARDSSIVFVDSNDLPAGLKADLMCNRYKL